jgi:hypothetical protein
MEQSKVSPEITMIQPKCVYEPAIPQDGTRILVESFVAARNQKGSATIRCMAEGYRAQHRTPTVVRS